MSKVTADKLMEMYDKMVMIRQAEYSLTEHYKLQEIRTPVHFGIGQEAVAVGVCSALERTDVVFSHHRCHNHYLAKGGDLVAMIGELYGREIGCSKGRGGSVHLTDRKCGVVATSAILGQLIPVAAGAALAFKMDKSKNIAVTFFGDGALDEGIVYETFNYASINNLPILFVCENNGLSTETNLSIRLKENKTFSDRAQSFGIKSSIIDGNNAVDVYLKTLEAVKICREGMGPFFLECKTNRWLEHVGPFYDHDLGRTYRTSEDIADCHKQCPINKTTQNIIDNKIASEEELNIIDKFWKQKVEEAICFVKGSPLPSKQGILDNVY